VAAAAVSILCKLENRLGRFSLEDPRRTQNKRGLQLPRKCQHVWNMWPATIIHSTPVHAAATAAAAANTHHYNGPRGTAGWPTPYPLASVSSRSRFLQRTSTASHIRPDCLVTTQHNGHRRHRPTSKAYINRRHNRVVCMSNGASEDSNKLPANTDLQNPLHQPVPLV
jgi:hypothetical protein